jgi:hypothetical protein
MCEFCNNPFNKDANHSEFAGFFSADAIEAAVQQANARREQLQQGQDSDEDSDGT